VWLGLVALRHLACGSLLRNPRERETELDRANVQDESLPTGALGEIRETAARCFGFDESTP